MGLLEFGLRGWFSMIYKIVQNGASIGEIQLPGTLKIGDTSYVLRDDILGAHYLEDENGRRLVTAARPSGITFRLFTLPIGDKAYVLKATSILGTDFVLLENGREVGSIVGDGFFWRGTADLPDSLPLETRAFMIWLVLKAWDLHALVN